MYKRIIYLIAVFCCLVTQVLAQNLTKEATEAKWNVIRSSIFFLATDTATFKKIKTEICSDCKSYEKLRTFIKENQMDGAEKLLADWRKIKIDTNDKIKAQQDFLDFKTKVLESISDRKYFNGKNQKKIFEDFQERIKGISITSSKTDENSEAHKNPQDTLTTTAGNENSEKETSWVSYENITYLELFVIVCLVCLSIVKISKAREERRKYLSSKNKIQELIAQKNKTWEELDAVRRDRDELQAENNELKNKLEGIKIEQLSNENKSIDELERINTIEWDVNSKALDSVNQEVFYTKYADLIDGFSPSAFVTKENNETIFEIKLESPSKATFRISENVASQKYALTNADYFLRKTCKYDVIPFGRIITDKVGQLMLQAGKWKIIEPAEISFK